MLYKLMPHPLKPELLPLEQYLLPDLPTIMGNVDYQTLRAQLLRMHQLLVDGGIERDFIARSVSHRRQFAEEVSSPHPKTPENQAASQPYILELSRRSACTEKITPLLSREIAYGTGSRYAPICQSVM